MSVCTGTEADTLNMNYVDSIRYVELKVRETDIYEILQQRCGFVRESITILPLVHHLRSHYQIIWNAPCTSSLKRSNLLYKVLV